MAEKYEIIKILLFSNILFGKYYIYFILGKVTWGEVAVELEKITVKGNQIRKM